MAEIEKDTFVFFAADTGRSALWKFLIIGINASGNVRRNISAAVKVMIKKLKRKTEQYWGYLSGVWGDLSGVRGYLSGVRGDLSEVWGDLSGVRGNLSGVRGYLSGVRGDLTGVWGDLTGVRGDLTGVCGNIDDCEITDEDRKKGISIDDLIENNNRMAEMAGILKK